MADNIDNKLDEFKSKIDSLFETDSQKSLKAKAELNDVSIQDIQKVVSEQFKIVDERLKSFSDIIKAIGENSDNQKLMVDTTRISSDLNTVYAKITSQDSALQGIIELIKSLDSKKDSENISKIVSELGNFYRGFDSITLTINKNFTEFLNEFKNSSSKEEYKKISLDIEGINNNTNSIISALSIIDHKYQDLQNLIQTLTENELKYTEGLEWLTTISKQLKEFSEITHSLPQNANVLELNENVSTLNSKLETGFNALATLDNNSKIQLKENFSVISEKLTEIINSSQSTNLDDKFAQLNNFIANALSEFSDVISGNLDDTIKFEKLENKFTIYFDELSKNIESKFEDFDKFDLVRVNIANNLQEMAKLISAKFDDIDKFENIENKIAISFDDFTKIIDTKFEDFDKFDSLKNDITANLQELGTAIVTRLSNNNIRQDILQSFSSEFKTFSEQITEKLDNVGTTDEIRKQILILLSQFTTEMDEKISKVDHSDIIKNEFSLGIKNLSEIIGEKFLQINEGINSQISALISNIDTLHSGVFSLDKTINSAISKNSDEIISNFEKLSVEITAIQNVLSAISRTDSMEKVEEDYKQVCLALSSLKPYLEPISTFDEKLSDAFNAVNKFSDENFIKLQTNLKNKINELKETMDVSLASNANTVSDSVTSIKDDITELYSKIEHYEESLTEINSENISSIKELVESAMLNIENLRIGNQLKQLAVIVEQNSSHIKESFDNMNQNFAQISESSNIEVLQKLNTSIPTIVEKLEDVRNSINSENTQNIEDLKNSFDSFLNSVNNTLASFSSNVKEGIEQNQNLVISSIQTELSEIKQSVNSLIESTKNEFINKTSEMLEHNCRVITDLTYELVEYKTLISQFKNEVDALEPAVKNVLSDKFNDVKTDFNKTIFEISEQSKNLDNSLSDKLNKIISLLDSFGDDKLNDFIFELRNSHDAFAAKVHSSSASLEEKVNISYGIICDFDTKYDSANAEIMDNLKELNSKASSNSSKIITICENTVNEIKNVSEKIDILKNSSNKNDFSPSQLVNAISENSKQNLQEILEKSDEEFAKLAEKSDEEFAKLKENSGQNLSKILNKVDNIKDNFEEKSRENLEQILNKTDELFDRISNSSKENLSQILNKDDEIKDKIIDTLNNVTSNVEKASDIVLENSKSQNSNIDSILSDIKTIAQNAVSTNDMLNTVSDKNDKDISVISSEVKSISTKTTELDSKLQQFAVLLDQMKMDLIDSVSEAQNDKISDKLDNTADLLNSKLSSFDERISSVIESNQNADKNLSLKIEDIYDYIAQLKSIIDVLLEKSSDNKLEYDINEIKSALSKKIENEISGLNASKMAENLDKILHNLDLIKQEEVSNNEISKASENNISSKIDAFSIEVQNLKNEILNTLNSTPEDALTNDSLKNFVSGFEFLQSNFLDEMKSEFKINQNILQKLKSDFATAFDTNAIKKIIFDSLEQKFAEKKAQEKTFTYTFEDIESDFAKIKLLFDQEQKHQFPTRLEEIRNIGLENIKLNRKSDKQIALINGWMDNTSKIIQALSDKVDKAEKLNIQEIKARLIQSEAEKDSSNVGELVEEFRSEVNKKYQIQEIKIENIDEKVSTLVQKQGEAVNIKSVVDAIQQSSMQTKSLVARVEGIENQILSIQTNIEKLINYIED